MYILNIFIFLERIWLDQDAMTCNHHYHSFISHHGNNPPPTPPLPPPSPVSLNDSDDTEMLTLASFNWKLHA